MCKPLVYVYDENIASNALRVEFPQGGYFTKIIPDFTYGTTWNFGANTQGNILTQNGNFDYLYYSARVPNYEYNKKGWQLYGSEVVPFFEEKLDYIGFNAKEKSDFIEYWKDQFVADQLYFVSFKFDEKLDEYVTLNFERKPTAQIRVLLEAFPLSERQKKSQFLWSNIGAKYDKTLLKQFVRSGKFDVLEWGGVLQKTPKSQTIIR